MIYFSLFLKSYFNFSIFSRKKKKKPDRNDVCVRHNVFRIVKIAFVKKKNYITDVFYFRIIRITRK